MDENKNPIDPEKILNEDEAPEAPAPETPESEAPAPEVPEVPGDGAVVPEMDDSLPQVQSAPAEGPVCEAEPQGGKKGRKKPLLIAAAAVVVVVILAIIIAAVTRSPLTLVAKGLANTAESIGKNPVIALMGDVYKDGSIELSCGLDDVTESMLGVSIEGSASVKLYSSDEAKGALAVNVEVDGASLLDATMTASTDEVTLASDVLFGGKAYGISIKNLAKNFDSSVFGPDGEYSIGVDTETLEKALDSIEDSKALAKDAAKVYEKTLDTLLKSVKAHARVAKSGEVLEFGDEEVKTTAVTVTMDGPALVGLAQDMVAFLRTDKDVKAFLTEIADCLAPFADSGFSGSFRYDGFGYGSMYGYDDPAELVDTFYEMLDELDEDLTDAAEYAEDADVEIALTFYVSKSGKLLVGIGMSADMDGDKATASVYAGPDFEKLSEISFRYSDSYTTLRGTYTVNERSKNAYSAQLKIREDGQTVFSGELNWDKKEGGLTAEFTDDWGDVYGLKGSLESGSKTTTLTLDSVYTDYEDIDLGIDVILKPSDKMPSVPKYTDILTMRVEDIEDLMDDMASAARGLFGSLASYAAF